jgi:hypothetical protein
MEGGTAQPATRPESKSEGGDNPQTESEVRSRQRVPSLDVLQEFHKLCLLPSESFLSEPGEGG